MGIDPRSLRTFLAVCRSGSISAAARDLNISQPSVSVVISQLETRLGTTLFERTRSGIQLSEAGIALKRKSEAMEALLRSAEEEVALTLQQVDGPLVIGGTPGALASLVPLAMSRLRKRFPRLQLQLLERSDRELIELLRSEQIELAMVTTGIDPVPEYLIEDPIARDPFALIVGDANAHLPPRTRLSALRDMRWVLPDAVGAFRRQVDALFIAADAPTPLNAIRCDSLLTTKAIVRQSDYITVLPRQVAAAELSIGALRAIEIEDLEFLRTIGIRRLQGRQLSPLAQHLLDELLLASKHSL